MNITNEMLKKVIIHVIKSEDYRVEGVRVLNAEFLQFAIDFFKEVANAKFNSKEINMGWYKNAFLNETVSPDDYAIYAGLNKKTIHDMHRSSARQVMIDASNQHFEELYNMIQKLVEEEKEVDLMLTIKFRGVSVDLNINESLIVINTLAVKRAALRGGLWGTIGKRAEKPLMITLCKLYQVPEEYYNAENFVRDKTKDVDREVDFYLKSNGKQHKCEVKLMGAGNTESADAVIARGSDVFIAESMSQQNKAQFDQLGVSWVALRDENGFRRFKLALDRFSIPYVDYNGDLDKDLARILDEML